jgi:hypothetical protein
VRPLLMKLCCTRWSLHVLAADMCAAPRVNATSHTTTQLACEARFESVTPTCRSYSDAVWGGACTGMAVLNAQAESNHMPTRTGGSLHVELEGPQTWDICSYCAHPCPRLARCRQQECNALWNCAMSSLRNVQVGHATPQLDAASHELPGARRQFAAGGCPACASFPRSLRCLPLPRRCCRTATGMCWSVFCTQMLV